MSEILNVKVPDGSFSAYVARPSHEPAPPVVVLQESSRPCLANRRWTHPQSRVGG